MTRYRMTKKAQTIIEYTMILIIVAAGLLLMQHYIKRAMQGRLRKAADSIGEQYDAHNVTTPLAITTIQIGAVETKGEIVEYNTALAESGRILGVKTTSKLTQDELISKTGTEELEAFPSDLYD